MENDDIQVDVPETEWIQRLTRQIEDLESARHQFVSYIAWRRMIDWNEYAFSLKECVFKRRTSSGKSDNKLE